MNEFKMSLFLAPISPVKDGGTGQIIKPATLKPYKTMTLQEVYRTITANTRLHTAHRPRAPGIRQRQPIPPTAPSNRSFCPTSPPAARSAAGAATAFSKHRDS